jgi:LPS-assembly lipoprotein
MPKRAPFRNALPVLAALALAGCGFHLRGELPEASTARSLFVTGIGKSNPFYGEFSQTLSYAGGSLADNPAKAGAVVRITRAYHDRRPVTLSKQGRANTFDLTFRVVYDVETPSGEILLPSQELEIRRDYFNDQSSPLGQGEEEAQMRLEMQREAAQALFRRVVYTLNKKLPENS